MSGGTGQDGMWCSWALCPGGVCSSQCLQGLSKTGLLLELLSGSCCALCERQYCACTESWEGGNSAIDTVHFGIKGHFFPQ